MHSINLSYDTAGELKRAAAFHQSGRLEKAGFIYSKILSFDPHNSDALHLSGVIAHQQGNNHKAVFLIKRAIDIYSQEPVYYYNLGNALKGAGFFYEAIESYKQAVNLKPDYVEAYNNLGVLYNEQNRQDEAVFCYQKALQINQNYIEAVSNLGKAYADMGRSDEAVECYYRAVRIAPDCAAIYSNAGSILQSLGMLNKAEFFFRKALEIKPDFGEVFNDLGTVLRDRGKIDEAEHCYKKAVDIMPHEPEAYNNLGNLYKVRGFLDAATNCYKKALDIDYNFTEAHYNLGNVFNKKGEYERALSCYRKALQLNPCHANALNMLVRLLQQECAWDELKEPLARLSSLTEKALKQCETAPAMPFLTFSVNSEPEYNYRIARSWASRIQKSVSGLSSGVVFNFKQRKLFKKRIRVAYLSSDFKNHATAHLMLSLFGLHDRERFEIFCYSYGSDDGSIYRKKIQRDSDYFIDISTLSHAEAANRIYADRIDILVDLKGYTEGGKLEISGFHPAPLQVSYLGFPGTTGADFFEYIITDRIVTPPSQRKFFSEEFVYMPHSYQVNDNRQEISAELFDRGGQGLPDDKFVFCSFNAHYKIEPVIFGAWMRILEQVPGSVLWLLRGSAGFRLNIRREAEKRGVDADRLIFAAKLPKNRHLARLRLADLALDTRTVNGHTTTSDALWAGVPVITLQGSHFASRVSSSLLFAIGLPELVAYRLDDYESIAVNLALNPLTLGNVRRELEDNRFTKPLFDTSDFVKNLEAAYLKMWKIYTAGENPRQI